MTYRLSILVLGAVAACSGDRSSVTDKATPAEPADPVPVGEGSSAREDVLVTWPAGDAASGRALFVREQCFQCHLVVMDDELGGRFHSARKDLVAHGGHAGHGGHASADHDLPAPLTAAVASKPPLILARQLVLPDGDPANRAAHIGSHGDRLTLAELTDLVAYFVTLARSDVARPDRLPADDLDLGWAAGDARRGLLALDRRGCISCHAPQGGTVAKAPTLTSWADPPLVVVRRIAAAHPDRTASLTIDDLCDLAALLAVPAS